jgi:Cd2+/Zn2+-exporting ATPase
LSSEATKNRNPLLSATPPIEDAFATGICAALGLVGYAAEHTTVGGFEKWAIIPLLGAYAAGGWKTLLASIESLRQGQLNVDTLMILAAIGAAILGDWVEGVVLLFLFSLSGTLEKFASYRTNRSIESLIQLRPRVARRVNRSTHDDETVEVEQLSLGDLVRIKPGERFPVDGKVTDGESWADESTLTGESRLIHKQPDSKVFSGTMNSQGTVLVEMTKLISDSTLERIVHMVHEAQAQKTPTQKLVESWQQPYVSLVLLGSAVTFFGARWVHGDSWNSAFYHAMVLLVAASPCAVVLSSPAVMLSAIALAGRQGVLVKGAVHLERLAQLEILALDKTGTITRGKPSIVEVWSPPECDVPKLLQLAGVVEKQSEHPLAIPILKELENREIQLPKSVLRDFQSHTGLGVHANVDGLWVGIGREGLFENHGIDFPDDIRFHAERMRSNGQTALPVITSEHSLRGVIGVADPLRDNAKSTIQALKRTGIPKIVLLTGDHPNVALAITRGLELDEIHAGLLPEDKVKQIVRLGESGKCVAMVGDGVNDAPALAAADIGIAMGGAGTDVALEVADAVLMRDDLNGLPLAIWIGRTAQSRVRQNMIFAFGMIGLLVIASFFNLPMWLGVLGHEGSTLIVVFNGVRMLWEKIPTV